VVIGGGIAGVSITRELAKAGVGVTLLERANQLCSGATWHAAGLVTRYAGSPKLKKMHVRSLQMLTELHEKHSIGLHLTGSIRVIEKGNIDRFIEAKHHAELAALYDEPGLETRMLSADEVAAMHPLVDSSLVECGLFTPKDGDIDPTLLTNCVAGLAREHGADIRFNAEVDTVEKQSADGKFTVKTKDGEAFIADAVVNAAGLWSQKFSQQLGLGHPAFVIEHHYAVTETLPFIEKMSSKDPDVRLPVLRDLKGSSYIRQERTGMLVGPYEGTCAVHREWKAGPEGDWAWDLFPDALERLEDCIVSACELIPALGEVGFKSVINGPTIWTGDSLPRCGRTRIPGYYDFNSLSYGIAHSLPLAEYLSHIILEGEQSYDLAAQCDPLRYGPWANDDYAEKKISETYSHNNYISYPFENRTAGREHVASATSPLTIALKKKGALLGFSDFAGVEVPLVYMPELMKTADDDVAQHVDQKTFDNHVWAKAAVSEAEHVRAKVGFGYSSFSKLRLGSGGSPVATQLLERITTNAVPKTKGACRLTYTVTPKGRIAAEFTITRLGDKTEHEYYIIGSRDYSWHDLAWLEQQRDAVLGPEDANRVHISNETDNIEILHVAGPLSLDLMTAICPAVADVGFLKMKELDVCGVPNVKVMRVSFTGELGFELHVSSDRVAELYEAIWAHPSSAKLDLKPFGNHAVNSLRLEKGFKIKGDLDYALWTEAGIEQFVALNIGKDKIRHDFVGRDIQETVKPMRRSAMFEIEAGSGWEWSLPSDCPVRGPDGVVVGYTTGGAFGTEVGKSLSLGFIVLDSTSGKPLAEPTTEGLTVEIYGNHWPLKVLEKPPVPVRGLPPKKPQTPKPEVSVTSSIPVSTPQPSPMYAKGSS